MKIAFVINSAVNCKHKNYISDILNTIACTVDSMNFDMADKKPLHEVFNAIQNYRPDLVITMDGAGFEMKTEIDSPALNQLPQRMMHLFFDKAYKYENILSEFLNLSHYVFISYGSNIEEFSNNHSNLPNVGTLPVWDKESIENWFSAYSEEMMLA